MGAGTALAGLIALCGPLHGQAGDSPQHEAEPVSTEDLRRSQQELVESIRESAKLLKETSDELLGRLDTTSLGLLNEQYELARLSADILGKPADAAFAEFFRAKLLRSEGCFAAAQEVLAAALREIPFTTHGHSYLLMMLADVRIKLGELNAAFEALDRLDDIEGVSPVVLDTCKSLRASAWLELGNAELASPTVTEHWKRAREAWRAGEEGFGAAQVSDILSAGKKMVYLRRVREDHEGAVELARALLADPRLFESQPDQRAELQLVIALALIDLAVFDRPRELEAQELLESILIDDEAKPPARLQAHLYLAEMMFRRGDPVGAAEHLNDAEDLEGGKAMKPHRAALTGVWARVVVLRSAIARREDGELGEHRERVLAAFEATLERWGDLGSRPGGFGFLRNRFRRELLGEFINLEVQLTNVEAALELLVRAQARGTLASALGSGRPQLEELRTRLLHEGRGMLAYLPTPAGSHLFLIDSAGVHHVPLAPRDWIAAARVNYLTELQAPLPGEASELAALCAREGKAAAKLGGLLLPDGIYSWLHEHSQLSIVGQDLLGPVPFAWLRMKDGSRFGAETAIDFALSIPVAVALDRRRDRSARQPRPTWDLVLVGEALHSVDGAGLPALPLSESLARDLTSAYDPSRVRLLLREEATLAQVARASEKTRVLQFLVHGNVDWSNEFSAGLQLTADSHDSGLLSVPQLAGWSAPELVLLTACRTAQAPQRQGDAGSADLSGGFLLAGSAAVLHSHSDLRFGNVLDWTPELHDLLRRERLSPAEALRRLRTARISADPELAPFTLGMLQVSGLGHEPCFGSDSVSAEREWGERAAFLLGSLALVATLTWRWRRRRLQRHALVRSA